jgi:hypothetical protein
MMSQQLSKKCSFGEWEMRTPLVIDNLAWNMITRKSRQNIIFRHSGNFVIRRYLRPYLCDLSTRAAPFPPASYQALSDERKDHAN